LPSDLGLVSDIEIDGKIEDNDLVDIIPFYRDTFLPSRLENLNNIIDTDEETSKNLKYLKFTEGVINGRISVIESEEDTDKQAKAKKAAKKAITNAKKVEAAAQKADFTNFVRKISKK
jgi:capsule polysaccharide export protein KpsC/LpsZ